jgi:ElaB/YqjD/DUF883 family membrane-anchored ribosome-binding protein
MDRNDVESGVATAAERASATAGALAEDAKAGAEDIARQTQDAYGHVRDHVRDAAAVVNDTVQQQPLIALMVAGTLGCVLGLLLARR